MSDVLSRIDAAVEQRCACGCGALLDPDGPSGWFATQGGTWLRLRVDLDGRRAEHRLDDDALVRVADPRELLRVTWVLLQQRMHGYDGDAENGWVVPLDAEWCPRCGDTNWVDPGRICITCTDGDDAYRDGRFRDGWRSR